MMDKYKRIAFNVLTLSSDTFAEDQDASEVNGYIPICQDMMSEQEGASEKEKMRSNLEKFFFFMLVIFSILSLAMVILTIRTHKKLQEHPAKLIMLVCIAEAVFCWNAFI
jgi:preprotein translocase subunit SecG